MTLYKSFIGIDIGKLSFFVSVHGEQKVREFDNDATGIAKCMKGYKRQLQHGFCVLEATGGYEQRLLLSLCDKGYAVHQANTRKVKAHIRSFGNAAKTDKLDAKALARYGHERAKILPLYKPHTKQALKLYELIQRRRDLKQMLVAEKNRRQAPKTSELTGSFDRVIAVITEEISVINRAIDKLIAADATLTQKRTILETVPGIGKQVSSELLALMPELGTLNRRQAASLAGLAPQAKDSGQYSGYRQVAPGRNHLKPMLFLAAMAARNTKSEPKLKEFYEHLLSQGKKKMVALVAVMRKIIVIANARLKEAAI